jgi:hypothetical protein
MTGKIPVERLVRPGVCISMEAQAAEDEDYRLTREDILRFEVKAGRIPEGALVLVATGWDRRWPDRARYMNERRRARRPRWTRRPALRNGRSPADDTESGRRLNAPGSRGRREIPPRCSTVSRVRSSKRKGG